MNPVIDCGFKNYIPSNRIEAIVDAKTSNGKKLIDEATRLIDCTKRRARKSIIVLTSGAIVLSAIPRIQLKKRMCEPEEPVVKKRIKKFHRVSPTVTQPSE